MTDAGTHVPLIVNWQGVIPEGKINNDLIDFSDFMPTFVELTGAKLPEDRMIDGKSFANQILGDKGGKRKWVYQEWKGKAWIRTQDWKLYEQGDLFDMVNDPYEKHPIVERNDTDGSQKIRSYLSTELTKLKIKK